MEGNSITAKTDEYCKSKTQKTSDYFENNGISTVLNYWPFISFPQLFCTCSIVPGIVKYTYTSPNIIYDNDDSSLLRSQLFEMASGESSVKCFQYELFKS